MKEYQAKRGNPYYLPTALYMRVIWAVRDYGRMSVESNGILEEKEGGADPVEAKAQRRDQYLADCDAIDRALQTLPEFYRSGVLANIIHRTPYFRLEGAHPNTWGRYKHRFLYAVARNMHLI